MSTRPRPRHIRTARRPEPMTPELYAQLVPCRCRLLPDMHQALHCAQVRESGGARQ